ARYLGAGHRVVFRPPRDTRDRSIAGMQDQLEKRVAELENEYRAGQEMLAELDAKRADLHQTLLRISGAIQVLKELLGTNRESPGADAEVPSSALLAG
ncbi:MAG: hypothetical protein ACRDTT_22945, partial [Pseudonocardiaceae bacterium]